MQGLHVVPTLVCIVAAFCSQTAGQCLEVQTKAELSEPATDVPQGPINVDNSEKISVVQDKPSVIVRNAVQIDVKENTQATGIDTEETKQTTTLAEIDEVTTEAGINNLTSTDIGIDKLTTQIVSESNESTTEVDFTFGSAIDPEYQDYDDFEGAAFNETASLVTDGRIVGGTAVAANSGLHTYAVYLNSVAPPNRRRCTGALITTSYVLTAASCVIHSTSVTARVGATTVTPVTGTPLTGRAIIYPKYYSNTKDYDIALVKLDTPATLSTTVGLVNVAYKHNTDDDKDVAGRTMVVVGFGSATAGGTESLMYTNMRIIPWTRCYKLMLTYEALVPGKTQSCLDTDGGTVGLCGQEDIGSLVLYKFDTDTSYTLAGIATQYSLCGTSVPNIFTRVGPFVDWIRKYVPSLTTYG